MQILPSTAAFIMRDRGYRGKLKARFINPRKEYFDW